MDGVEPGREVRDLGKEHSVSRSLVLHLVGSITSNTLPALMFYGSSYTQTN